MHYQKELGRDILNFLSQPENQKLEASHLIESFEIKKAVTGADIFEEASASGRYFFSPSDDSEGTVDDFKQGWIVAAEKGSPLPHHSKDYVGSNVISISGKGLSRCKMTWSNRKEPEIFVKKQKNGENILYNVLTPAGHMTGPHMDNSGSGHDLGVSFGSKLILFWQPSEKVLEDYKLMHGLNRGNLTANCVKCWPGLHWVILRTGESIVISPGIIHAVLSADNSVASGWNFLNSEWICNGSMKVMVEWELKVIEERWTEKGSLKKSLYGRHGILNSLKQDMNMWKDWMNTSLKNDEIMKDLRDLINLVNKRLQKIDKVGK